MVLAKLSVRSLDPLGYEGFDGSTFAVPAILAIVAVEDPAVQRISTGIAIAAAVVVLEKVDMV